jgi:hypothetical protein
MKKTKNALLVMLVGVIMITFAAISCSKKSDPPPPPPVKPAPTIASFTPTTAAAGETVTITGANFTGATAVSFGGTAAASFNVASATSITAVLGAGATGDVSVTTPAGTGKKAGFTLAAPKIDGFNNSDEVAATNLKAHWTFDDTQEEVISGAVPVKAVGAAYETGQIGKAVKLTSGYLVYPTIANLNTADAIPSYTVSMWVNIQPNPSVYTSLFQLTGTNFPDIWGQVMVVTPNYGTTGDTLQLLTKIIQITAANGVVIDDLVLFPGGNPSQYSNGAGKWTLVSVRYDGPSHKLDIVVNGVQLGTKISNAVVDPATFILEAPIQTLMGTLAYKDDGFNNSANAVDRPWACHGITGSLDDVRVFNTALTDAQLLALTHLGQAGR